MLRRGYEHLPLQHHQHLRKKGQAWLDELPQLVEAISSRLDLRDLNEVTNLTYNYVLSGFHGNNPIILKLGLDHDALTREAFALKCFADRGAVEVISEDYGMLLVERAMPGASLKSCFPDKEHESIKIACGVMKKLHQANIPMRLTISPISKIGLRL
ncbi:aminoglycoside phosphotransferase family protein [Orientia tsutsugamushi]|uniref:aminoglycoside phosphotransferase family protein n=1 Tax=Orientia tsutsugamushi TaxID=784 RepID=UPI0035282243